jgi:hypothetical protein
MVTAAQLPSALAVFAIVHASQPTPMLRIRHHDGIAPHSKAKRGRVRRVREAQFLRQMRPLRAPIALALPSDSVALERRSLKR